MWKTFNQNTEHLKWRSLQKGNMVRRRTEITIVAGRVKHSLGASETATLVDQLLPFLCLACLVGLKLARWHPLSSRVEPLSLARSGNML